jgi:MFS family permease
MPRVARYTWSRQWYALGLIGVANGVFGLTPFLVKRSLDAEAWHVALLIAIWQAPWVLAPAIQPLMARVDPQRAWRWMAVLAHAPLLMLAFVPVESLLWPLLGSLGLCYLVSIAYIPHRGALLRTNYDGAIRGRMYGFMQAITFLGITIGNKAGGILMDLGPQWTGALYVVAAVLGMAGYWLHGRIRWRGQGRPHTAHELPSWREALQILKVDRAFRTYEFGFMVYGIAFLMGWALLFLYAEGPLGLTYNELTNATAYAFPLAWMVGSLVWGRASDRLGVIRLTSLAFFALAAFYVSMQFVTGPWSYLLAFAFWGFSMAGVDVGWSLGPLHFAPDGRAHMYAAVHFALVGIRSCFAPFLGFALAHFYGFRVAFGASATLLVVGALIVRRLARRSP